MDREGLADFLKRRRAAVTPADVGLPDTGRRRTPGLRREEVAALAHMSVDFYERLEQHRGANPSVQTLAALARALRLNPEQRSHLYELAGYTAPPRAYRTDHPSPSLLRVLDQLQAPAQIVTDLGVTIAQNAAARALVGDQTQHTGLSRSMIFRWFTDPEQRLIHPPEDHAEHSRFHVAGLRAVHGRDGSDPEVAEMVSRLLEQSEEFAALWKQHEVASRANTIKHFTHPLVGRLTLDCQVLTSQNQTEQLVIFSAAAGSEDEDRLRLLSVVGAQQFASA
jgi:transcriptional regulator with XRE-family HTH domain